MPGIGVINNPRSRQNVNHPDRIRKLGYYLGQDGASKSTFSFSDIESCARDFKKRGIDILALNGGDGTNHVTLTKFIEVYGDDPLPKIALLRGGTLNTIADGFRIKGKPQYLMFNLVEKYHNGLPFEIVKRRPMRIGDKYGFIFGNGLVANFMDTYYETGTPSTWQGIKTLVRGIGSTLVKGKLARQWMRPVRAKVTVDGEEIELNEFSSILSGTTMGIGVGFDIYYRCAEDHDRMHAMFFTCSPFGIVRELPAFYKGRQGLHPRVGFETTCKEYIIDAQEPFSYTIDGDMYRCESGKLEVGLGPLLDIIIR